ncbi:hypothetical protein [Streptomyces sp. NPDC002265]|uniref:hypothetical protein n=1 Tax=Streptomyces sp. NPDC002265 TaxID=3154415 RepID=UPI003333C5FF
MSPTAVISGAGPAAPGHRAPLLRLAFRQYRILAALVLLLALLVGAPILLHHADWADAVVLRDRAGGYYRFLAHPGMYDLTGRLLDDGGRISFQPALLAATAAGVLTAREWETRRVTLALTQSVTPARWFGVHWATVAVIFTVPTLALAMLYHHSATYAARHDLLVHGAAVQGTCFAIGPVTVAYAVLGVAAGAYTGTLLRRIWPTLIAAPALTWLAAAVLVRSRLVLLVDFPLFDKVHGYHSGGILGLQLFGAEPQDTYLINSLDTGDYWPYQLASGALVLATAALLVLSALRIVRRRTA